MKTFFPGIFFSLIAVSLLSCTSGNPTGSGKNNSLSDFKRATVIPSISCQKDTSITYALYLPKTLSASHTNPVILAFDPHGCGSLPLQLYQDLAEKYRFIMIGSNNSKNGTDMAETSRIITTLFTELHEQYPIDTNRIYAMGFSGGSRIASLTGLYRGGISGVFGCGAGFPGVDQPARYRFDYIGFAGIYDFNMNELVSLDEQLETLGFNHALFLFQGIHEWPSKPTMENAFLYAELCAMRKKLIPPDENLITAARCRIDTLLRKDLRDGDRISYHRNLSNMVNFLKDLSETSGYRKKLDELENDPAYLKQKQENHTLREKETGEQQFLQENFFTKDVAWWKDRIAGYDKRIGNTKNVQDAAMCRRIKSYMSLVAYMTYTRLVSSGDAEKAKFALEVYGIVDPENASKIK
jgi:predicted esterase